AGFRRRKRLIEAGPVVRIQIVLHQADRRGLRIILLHQGTHAPRLIAPRTPGTDPHVTPAAQRFAPHQLMTDAFALVLVVDPSRSTRPRPLGGPDLTEPFLHAPSKQI